MVAALLVACTFLVNAGSGLAAADADAPPSIPIPKRTTNLRRTAKKRTPTTTQDRTPENHLESANRDDYDVTSSFALPASYKDPIPGPSGGWIQMPVEDTSSLSVSDFAAKYVDTGTPVILRRSAADASKYPPAVTPDWLLEHCDVRANIDSHGQIPDKPNAEWGGFLSNTKPKASSHDPEASSGDEEDSSDDDEDDDDADEITLGAYLGYLPRARELAATPEYAGRVHYGFDYDAKCSCPSLLEQMPWYQYFQDDYLLLDPVEAFKHNVWPSLLVGPVGSSSALHVDNSFYPFHLTLLSGRKVFRAVRFADWKDRLTRKGSPERDPLYKSDGETIKAIDGYNDDAVLDEFIRKRGCHVFNATLIPGDMVYIPTGVLHGGKNIAGGGGDGDEPAVAVTSNILDPTHAGQVYKEYCLKYAGSEDETCAQMAKDRKRKRGIWKNKWEGEGAAGPGEDEEGSAGSVTYDFWDHALNHPDFCDKFKEEDDCPHVVERCLRKEVTESISKARSKSQFPARLASAGTKAEKTKAEKTKAEKRTSAQLLASPGTVGDDNTDDEEL